MRGISIAFISLFFLSACSNNNEIAKHSEAPSDDLTQLITDKPEHRVSLRMIFFADLGYNLHYS